MLTKLIEKIEKLSERNRDTSVDPSQFDDPLAQKTAWLPLKPGGTNFCTRQLVDVGAHRVEFRATVGARLFYLLFLFMGLGAMIFMPMAMEGATGLQMFMPMLVGLVFTVVGGCMYYFGTTPVVFDRGTSHYWRGRTSPDRMPDRSAADNWTDFEKIHALQIIAEWCRGSSSSNGGRSSPYFSYELNLVLSNGDQLNVVDHGNLRKLRKDAARLARFLDVPLWDAA